MSALRQAPMISIPLKTTDEVDFVGPLRQFIRSNYGSPEKYSEECTTFARLRQDMRGAGKDEAGRDLLYRYYGQLELLELRFPIDEDHIRISFNWLDAFTDSPIAQYSLAYEKACVLFNIAAILSLTAITQIRSEVAGMKKAYHSLQACAGLLNFINDNFLHAPSTDLSREMVKTLSAVMLAQAQEVFTEKQIRDAGKSSLIAKLAAETANLYHVANETLTELIIAGNIDNVWGPFCQIKEKYFASLAQFYQAGFEEDKDKYGLAIGRYTVSQNLMKEALALARSYSGSFARYSYLSNDPGTAMVELLKSALELIVERSAAAKKENDVIYNEAVVKDHSLPAIARLASAKPISLHDLYAGQDVARIVGNDIFQKLVPLSVHESASIYSEEIDKLLRSEQERSDIADVELATALDFLGLPKSLHQFKVSDDQLTRDLTSVPDSIRISASEISGKESAELMSARFELIKHTKRKIEQTIEAAQRTLEEEAHQCERMTFKYRDQWRQEPSAKFTSGMLTDLKNYKASLISADSSDARMFREFDGIERDISELSQNTVDAILHQVVLGSAHEQNTLTGSLLDLPQEDITNDVAIKIDQVEDSVRKLGIVKKERQQTLQDLKDKARKDDISSVLILNKKTPGIETRVFANELEKFKPHQTRISATISRQEQLIEELTATSTSVLENKSNQSRQKKWDSATRQCNEKIRKLETSAATYRELDDGLNKATAFYRDLSARVENISQNAQRFVQRRQQEGRTLVESLDGRQPHADTQGLRQQLERMNMNGNTQRPQPQPPNSYRPTY